jgi:hypothetical protein
VLLPKPGWSPAKSEALSMLGPGHNHADRVVALLEVAQSALAATSFRPFDGPIGLDVTLRAPTGKDPWDATNYVGGIGDVLEDKSGRNMRLDHLGPLAAVALYVNGNDRQIREVHYRQVPSDRATASGCSSWSPSVSSR